MTAGSPRARHADAARLTQTHTDRITRLFAEGHSATRITLIARCTRARVLAPASSPSPTPTAGRWTPPASSPDHNAPPSPPANRYRRGGPACRPHAPPPPHRRFRGSRRPHRPGTSTTARGPTATTTPNPAACAPSTTCRPGGHRERPRGAGMIGWLEARQRLAQADIVPPVPSPTPPPRLHIYWSNQALGWIWRIAHTGDDPSLELGVADTHSEALAVGLAALETATLQGAA